MTTRSPSVFELCVLDVAGTTVEDDGAVARCIRETVARRGAPPSDAAVTAVMGLPKPAALRARILDGGGEARWFEGWFDAELGIDCTSTFIAGEPNRCLPPLLEERVYLDAACALSAVESSAFPPGGVPAFTVEAVSGDQTCDAYQALAVGAEQLVASVFVEDASGACTEIVGERAVHALEPTTLDVFARLDVVDTPDFLIGVREERGPDGSYRFVAGLLPSKVPCRAMPIEFGGQPFCVPTRARVAATFGGSGCAEPAVPLDACELPQLRPITDVLVNACGQQMAVVHQPGKIVDDVFLPEGAPSCNGVSLGEGRVLGPPNNGFSYPQVAENLVLGPALWLAPMSIMPSFRLAMDGRPCDPTETAAGLRCVPPLVPRPTKFLDAACTNPLTTAPPIDCWPPPVMGRYGSDGLLVSVGQPESEHQGPIYEGGGGAPCTLVAESFPGLFYMASELPVETLPEIVRRVE